MEYQLDVVKSAAELTDRVKSLENEPQLNAFLCEIGGGVLRFATALFPRAELYEIQGQVNEREPEGRGAHFDVYASYVDKRFPWIGVYNLAGQATVKTTVLDPALSSVYYKTFPDPTDEAFEARRHYAGIALATPGAQIGIGQLKKGTALVLPQFKGGPDIIHDITPTNRNNAGSFLKLVVPRGDHEVMQRMHGGKYLPIDELLTESLEPAAVSTPETTRVRETRSSARSLSDRRPCNLD